MAYATELTDPDRARILACRPGGDLLPNGYEYDLEDTPCEAIRQRDVIKQEPGWRLTDAEPMVVTSFRLA